MFVFIKRFANALFISLFVMVFAGTFSSSVHAETRPGPAKEAFDGTNAQRVAAGLPVFCGDPALQAAADLRARELEALFSHTRPNGLRCFTAWDETGVTHRATGENIACGQKTGARVVECWMESPDHRANILNPKLNRMGLACWEADGTLYWVQCFAD